ncbi:flagellar biosynthetic protein FliR [Paracoccus isoporae]|uniref:Flagellar biosynthetic protein FliR n=1 Tax=Paracoccus isoporae TaxID=591205 RepID=A0A1G6Z7W2_9RHOB|nr:flagellar biosynthetic protein FliR [Paracoccus isoporae]SDD98077.1 flagellar biosynthetic protein FliR [Paracoccus isoporae]
MLTISSPADLTGLIEPIILGYFRVQGVLLVLPAFSDRVVPQRVRIAAAMALAPLSAELAGGPQLPSAEVGAIGTVLLRCLAELLIGGLIAAPARIIAFALHMASTAIAATASLSQLIGTGMEAAPHPIGQVYHLAGMALLMAMSLPLMLLDLVAQGYAIFPAGRGVDPVQLLPGLIGLFATSFMLAMTMASPFILGGLLYQMLAGIVNRVMPALPVVFIGAPIIIGLALIVLAALSPSILAIWAEAVLRAGLR